MKPPGGLARLPSDTFVPAGRHDPLLHSTQDIFWLNVEPHFNPITEEHLEQLQVPPLEEPRPAPRTHAEDSSAPHAQLDVSTIRPQSFPLCQRLTAALVDEGRGEASAAKSVRAGLSAEDGWVGGPLDVMRDFNALLEERVRTVLQQYGLLDAESGTELVSDLRLSNWHLRNVVTVNARTRSDLSTSILKELESQAQRRQKKIQNSKAEIAYLESFMDKGKRWKGRVTRLLNQMHPNRHLMTGDRLSPAQLKPGLPVANGTGVEKAIPKKRRRKSNAKTHSHGTSKSNTQKTNPHKTSKTNAGLKGGMGSATSVGASSIGAGSVKGVPASKGSTEQNGMGV